MPLKHRGYCFDLDGYEDPDGIAPDTDRQFTVDSRQHGQPIELSCLLFAKWVT